METSDNAILLSDVELKEIFELFSSSTEYELSRIYDMKGDSYFERVNLSEEYHLTLPKRDFALDAVRSVFFFLYRHGYKLEKNGEVKSLSGIKKHFIA